MDGTELNQKQELGRIRYKKIVRNSVNIILILSVVSIFVIKYLLLQPFPLSYLFAAGLVLMGVYNNLVHTRLYDFHPTIGPYVDAGIYSSIISIIIFETGGFQSPAFFLYYMIIFSTRSFLGPNIPLIVAGYQSLLVSIFGILYMHEVNLSILNDIFIAIASMVMMAIYSRTLSVEFLAEYQARKALEEVDQRKSEFMALASHYLRTPITTLKGYVDELTRSEVTPEERKEFISRIKDSVNKLGNIAEDFLNVVALERGVVPLHVSDNEFITLVWNVYENYVERAEQKGIRFTLEAPGYPIVFFFDQEKIIDTVDNLIDNAVKFTEKGSVSITIRPTGAVIILKIEDTGIGMEEEDQDELFTKMHRAQDPLSFDYEGKGIGLYVSKLIAEAHGGSLKVQSKKGKGTSCTLTLPIVDKKS